MKRCWIVGTGPSLDHVNLSLLKQEVTIGCNSIFMRMDPTYYCVSDSKVVKRYGIDLDTMLLNSHLVLHKNVKTTRPVLHRVEINNNTKTRRDQDFLECKDWDLTMKTAQWTRSVIMDFCFPLAASLGFDTVYLLGCDAKPNGHFSHDKSGGGYIYIRKKPQWMKTKALCKKHNIKVFNCSKNSAIDAFPKMDYLVALRRRR